MDLGQVFMLLTPWAILSGVASGIAMGVVILRLRPAADDHITAYLAVVLGSLWYIPQALQAWLDGPSDVVATRTVTRFVMYLVLFVIPMWVTLRVGRSRA